ncbi:MAG: cyclopropane-fatty-acyl-phospholipid synthase family protein [Verrucomicrobiae bacterium]|nr:cyclopropane-fatty-acyl-phospholipid synthase family protein [Verrucomicrobiae bacterium]
MPRISEFIEVNDPGLKKRYSKATVAAGHFVVDYMNQKIDLKCDFKDLMKHKDKLFTWNFVGHHLKFFFHRFLPEVLIHSKKQDERINRSHYDDKNDLFSWFLGPRMIYTSCYYKEDNETLEQAQDNKLNLVAKKMQLKAGESLLDIGCGWGTLVAHMAKYFEVDATGITIAEAGKQWGDRLIRENEVEDHARVLRMDYRDIPPRKYDKICCLEMAEHVGVKHFRKFMHQIYDLLEEDGIFYLQIAGLRERGSVLYGPNQEDIVWGLFMNEHIFSGADASMPLNWDLKQMEKAGFEIRSVENIGFHYVKTIESWYQNWMNNKEKVLEKYGEYTFRKFQVFLGWSIEIGRQGGSSAYQIVAYKNINQFNRKRFLGQTSLGAINQIQNRDSVSSETTKETLIPKSIPH